jgi:small subunit ribosomal protein S21
VVGPLEVEVYNNDVGQALKVLKNKLTKDGILAELKARRHAEKPSEKKRRKHREALKRLRKSKGKRRQGGWRPDRSKVFESRPIRETVTAPDRVANAPLVPETKDHRDPG